MSPLDCLSAMGFVAKCVRISDYMMYLLKHNSGLSVTVSLGCIYTAYYVLYIAKRPVLAASPRWTRFLLRHCPALAGRYWPTVWCPGPRAQTILRTFFMSCPRIPRTKEFLDLPDGGHVALDWSREVDATEDELQETPIVVILPGIVGNDDQSYSLHLMKECSNLRYRSVVFSNRGNGGAALKTARTYNACNTEDLRSVLEHIAKRYPSRPLLAVGVSLGGMILTNYVAAFGSRSLLLAAMTISAPWDTHKSSAELEAPVNRRIFNRRICDLLKEKVRRHADLFREAFNLDYVYKSETIRDFDERFTAPLFGYDSCGDYYDASRTDEKLDQIKTPLLALNALDDPFSPGYGVPMEGARRSEFVMIALTSHGGHMGFIEGVYPRHTSYMFRVFAQFAAAMVRHGDV